MGIMRMIKLFGWENRIADRIQDKRDEELKHLGKLKVSFRKSTYIIRH